MAYNCLNNTKYDAPNGSPYYRDWTPRTVKSSKEIYSDDHEIVCRSRYKMRCAASGKTIMPGDLITKIVQLQPADDARVLRPIPFNIEYETDYVLKTRRERSQQPHSWCLRDEQPIGIDQYGYTRIWTYWLASLQSSYDQADMDGTLAPNTTLEEYAEQQGYPLSNTFERINKIAIVIQRFLRGRYFRNNLYPTEVKNYYTSSYWDTTSKCYATEETSILPGDRFVVATPGNPWCEYFRKVRVINKVWRPLNGSTTFHAWFITFRYDNGEIYTMRKSPFTHMLRLACGTQEQTRKYAVDTLIPLKKNEIYEIVQNMHFVWPHMPSAPPKGPPERRELVKIVDILDFRGKRIVIQFFDGTFKVYEEKKFRRLLMRSFCRLQARPELRYVSPANEYLPGTKVLIKGNLQNRVAASNHVWAGTVTKVLPDKKREVLFDDGDIVVYTLRDLQLRVITARNYMRMHPFICGTILHGTHPYQPGVEVKILFDKDRTTEKVYRGLITDCEYKKRHGSKSVCLETKATAHSSKIMLYRVVYEDGDTRWYSSEQLDKLREDTIHCQKKVPHPYPYAASARSNSSLFAGC